MTARGSRTRLQNASVPCPDCGLVGSHICIPCADEDDMAEFRDICGEVDQPSGKPIRYYINAAQAAQMNAVMNALAGVLV